MDIIEQFLHKVSYKFPKGYPDINDEQDILMLEGMLKELGVDFLFEKKLEWGDLSSATRKYSRLTIIDDKIKSGTPFKLEDGTEVPLQYTDNSYSELFTNQKIDNIKKIGGNRINQFTFFKTPSGKEIGFSAITKTKDLGGTGGSKAQTSERQERGLVDTINKSSEANVPKLLTGTNGVSIPNVSSITKLEGNAAHGKEHYADLVLNTLDNKKILISAKGLEVPNIAGGGLTGITLFGENVQNWVVDFYEKAYQFYKKRFESNPDYTFETNLRGNKDFSDVGAELPDDIVLEILRGTAKMGGPIDYYYIGEMDIKSPTITKNPKGGIIIDFSNDKGRFVPIEMYAEQERLFPYLRKRDGDVFFTDNYQIVNGIKIRQIFKSSANPNKKATSARLGILDKPRGTQL